MANRAAHLFARAAETPDKVALIFGETATTFAQMADAVRRAMAELAARGVVEGDHVGVLLPAGHDFIVVQHALFALGAAITPVNILYTAGDIAHAISCCDLRFVISDAALTAQHSGAAFPDGCAWLTWQGAAPMASAYAPPLADRPDEVAAMHLLTSATTGKAKGVILTHGNLAANYDRTPDWLGLTGADVILCALPLYNTFGLNQCINAMMVTGATMVLLTRFDVQACLNALERYRCTFMPAVPTMLQKLYHHADATDSHFSSLTTIMTGGAPVPSAMLKAVIARNPSTRVLTGYGLTEGTALVTLIEVTLNEAGEVATGRSVGRVLDGMQVAILDEAGADLGRDAVGEIAVSGPNIMAGYFRAEEETRAARHGPWLRTGDIGTIDADGLIYIVDRKKDVIIRGGQNIYPIDIEEVLYAHPAILEAAVVAAEDDMLGEVPTAFVALKSGMEDTPDALMKHCRAHLAKFKIPAAVTILPELPKGPTGKILRRALTANGTAKLAAPSA